MEKSVLLKDLHSNCEQMSSFGPVEVPISNPSLQRQIHALPSQALEEGRFIKKELNPKVYWKAFLDFEKENGFVKVNEKSR